MNESKRQGAAFNGMVICGRSKGRGRPWDDSEFIGQQQTETNMRLMIRRFAKLDE